jgi:hypothetical protein
MKKILLIASLLIASAGFGFAQTTPAATGTKKVDSSKTKASGAVHLKKDGTPDMRYKENKQPPVPPVHLKKDSTPDKRYKENKTPPAKTAATKNG